MALDVQEIKKMKRSNLQKLAKVCVPHPLPARDAVPQTNDILCLMAFVETCD